MSALDITPIMGGRRFRLPPRPATGLRTFGIALLVFGLFGSAFGAFWIANVLGLGSKFDDEAEVFAWFSLLMAAFGLLVALPFLGLAVLGAGLLTGRSRCEILTDDARLRLREHVGPLRWTFARPRADLRELVVEHFVFARNDHRSRSGADAVVAHGSGKALPLGLGYPRELLAELAAAIGRELELPVRHGLEGDDLAEQRAGRIDASAAMGEAELPPQPSDSDIEWELADQGLALRVPPAGLVKGSRGLFVFAIVWLTFVGGMGGFLIAGGQDLGDAPWIFAFVLGSFALVGCAMLAIAVAMGRRRAEIVVTREGVSIRRISPFGTKARHFPAADIAAIRVDFSGMSVNDRRINELQIHVHDRRRKALGMLSQRDDAELEWMAALMRHALSA